MVGFDLFERHLLCVEIRMMKKCCSEGAPFSLTGGFQQTALSAGHLARKRCKLCSKLPMRTLSPNERASQIFRSQNLK
jgi:hypothetical protein